MKVSKRAQAVPPSATIAVDSRAKQMKAQGIDVIGFGAGEPDFDTPDFIKESAIKALKAGKVRYTPAEGTVELRTAVAEKLKRDNNLTYAPEQIIVNLGAKHSIYAAMQAVIDPGDEVIIPAPFWVTYPETIKLAEGTMKVVQTDPTNEFKMTAKQLKAALTKKTAMLVLNSPNNPGGFTYTPDELAALAKVLEGTEVVVLSDEIYEKLIYGDTKFISFAALSTDAYNRTLTVNGLSKTYAMTGWRLGYTAGPANVIKAMSRLQSHMTQNPVTFTQDAAITALKDTSDTVEKMRLEFEKRSKIIADMLNAIPGVVCPKPTGAFYAFPDVSKHFGRSIGDTKIAGSMEFAQALLEQAKVAVVPGAPFGAPNNIRLSFACSIQNIEKGVKRIAEWLK
ncbi:MAG: pyridoxal phosphate-dependent aminotransferase [Phycisphaerae bacterium]|nr:pyridoxal phosphate-dependent aminotransferase [Phycisphaerae bacterium]